MTFVADGDVVTATETEVMNVVPDSPGRLAERSVGQILALVLVAILTSRLLGVQGPDQATIGYYLTVIGVALPIALIIWNKNK